MRNAGKESTQGFSSCGHFFTSGFFLHGRLDGDSLLASKSNFKFEISDFKFQVSHFRFYISDFCYLISKRRQNLTYRIG